MAAAFRIANACSAFRYDLLDVDIGAIVAALRHETDAVEAGGAGPADLGRVCVEFVEPAVDELDIKFLSKS